MVDCSDGWRGSGEGAGEVKETDPIGSGTRHLSLHGKRRRDLSGKQGWEWEKNPGKGKILPSGSPGKAEVVEKRPLFGPKSPPPACATPVGEMTTLPKLDFHPPSPPQID